MIPPYSVGAFVAAIAVAATNIFGVASVEFFSQPKTVKVQKLAVKFLDTQKTSLTVVMGGHWGGAVDFDLMESNLEVDYVRYYSIDGLGSLKKY